MAVARAGEDWITHCRAVVLGGPGNGATFAAAAAFASAAFAAVAAFASAAAIFAGGSGTRQEMILAGMPCVTQPAGGGGGWRPKMHKTM